MRFLLTGKAIHPIPPEVAMGLFDAMVEWVRRYSASGKIEQMWACAGLPAGGGILDVDSLDELDAVMAEFPFGPFAEMQIVGMVDLEGAKRRARDQVILAATAGGG